VNGNSRTSHICELYRLARLNGRHPYICSISSILIACKNPVKSFADKPLGNRRPSSRPTRAGRKASEFCDPGFQNNLAYGSGGTTTQATTKRCIDAALQHCQQSCPNCPTK
jgi:hypothetical protein